MKVIGIILSLIGLPAFVIGLIVCFVTLTSDYASSECAAAERDKAAIEEATKTCRQTRSTPYDVQDCIGRNTIGKKTQMDCDLNRSYMNRQLIMGVVPTIIGGILAFAGVALTIFGFIRSRKARSELS
jgi:hypothetical protein